jgi:hypothetical protein
MGSVTHEDARVPSVAHSNLCEECASRMAQNAVRRTCKLGHNLYINGGGLGMWLGGSKLHKLTAAE